MIPVFKPKMNKAEILTELEKILDSGWIGLGPKTEEFGEKFAHYQGAKYGIAVNSATAALHLALIAAGLKEGDEVLVPSMTFASTALVALYERVVPVFVDIDSETLCIDPNDLKKKITAKTKAIIPVHFGGHACKMDEIMEIASEHGLQVIEDCAHASGAEYKGKRVGSIGVMGCFSFHAVKNLPTGDGGMVVTNDESLAKHLKKLRWLGIDKDTWGRSGGKYAWRYAIDELGYKYHMNDITAVIGLAQLKTLNADNARRRELAYNYTELLKDIDWIESPVEKEYTKSAWHNYVVKVKNGKRDELNQYLASKGVSTGVHYEPIHFHKVFSGCCKDADLSITEKVWTELLTLPLFPELQENEQAYILNEIKRFEEVSK